MYGKNFSTFRTFCHEWSLQIETFSKNFQREVKDVVRFVGDMIEKFEFDFKTFSVGSMQ
jgi:hypothetical protein